MRETRGEWGEWDRRHYLVADMTLEIVCSLLICVILGQNLQEQCPKMYLAKVGLAVALEEGHVRNQGWRL